MQTVTEILIDFSGSMEDKLTLTKNILLWEIVPNLDYSSRIGVKTFTATKDKQPRINPVLPLSITNKEQLNSVINSLEKPIGNTPIAAAIKNSVCSLKEYLAFNKKIILITDGQENCDGDYAAEANAARREGVDCEIHIIGIGLSTEAIKQAHEISTISKGSFSSIPFVKGQTGFSPSALKLNLASFYSAVKQPTVEPTILTAEPPFVSGQNVVPKPEISPLPDLNQETKQIQEVPLGGDATVKLIIEEIKEIRKELVELRNAKEQVSEVVENAEQNERIRKASEEYLFEVLKKKYPGRVKWLNENGESYSDHDFEVIDLDGSVEYYIECKGTPKSKPTFYLTKEEWRLFLNHTKNYQLYFVKYTFESPEHVFIDNLLDWMLKGKVVPYLKERQVIKEERIFLTHIDV